MKKVALISMSRAYSYEEYQFLNSSYVNWVEKLGFLPVLVPSCCNNLSDYFHEFSIGLILLSGGFDKSRTVDGNKEEISEDRTDIEYRLIEFAISNSVPVIGICRGMHVLNKYFGGEIVFSSKDYHEFSKRHVNTVHEICYHENTFSKMVLKSGPVMVNSYHQNHVSLEGLGDNMFVFATDMEDSNIEGIYHSKYKIMGVQWHPERAGNDTAMSVDLFLNILDRE